MNPLKIQSLGCRARREPQQYVGIARIRNADMRPIIGFEVVLINGLPIELSKCRYRLYTYPTAATIRAICQLWISRALS